MLDGHRLIDVHLHAARLGGLKLPWDTWVHSFDSAELRALYRADGTVDPAAFDKHLDDQGVDVAVVLSEYSPRVTGTQAVEDMVPLADHNPSRIRFAANVNPHLHFPVDQELVRQLDLGAAALKVHPVHGGFAVNDRALYPAYTICQERGVPIVVHCGTSTFPGALNQYGDPILLDDVLRDFPRLAWLVVRRGRIPRPDQRERVARAVRTAAVTSADVLRAAQLDPADPTDDLRNRLAGHPRHCDERSSGREVVPGRRHRRCGAVR